MTDTPLTRRDAIKFGSAAAALTFTQLVNPQFAFPAQSEGEKLVPFLNTPRARRNMLDWETLDAWLTPDDQVFSVQHYGTPEFDAAKHALEITGLVDKPQVLTLEQLKKRPHHDQLMTLECSGNGASPGFSGAVYNSKWTGTPLASLLKDCGIQDGAKEVVFIGVDRKEETLRKDTRRELKVEVPFGRSMSLEDAMNLNVLLAWDRNGAPIEHRNGAPIRVIVPGWYGVANVKWLKRIEVRNTRYMGRYMGRDYVTVRGERNGDEINFVETSVNKMNLKSVVARVTRQAPADGKTPVRAYGAVWGDGTPIDRVEVRVDDGPWQVATLDKEPRSKFSWTFFSIDLGALPDGKHTIVSRGIDKNGRVQPSADDDEIALKKTYWEAYQQWPREFELKA